MRRTSHLGICAGLALWATLLLGCQNKPAVDMDTNKSNTTSTETGMLDGTPIAEPEKRNVACGLMLGDRIDAFQVVKVGGIDDGVPVGEELCYR